MLRKMKKLHYTIKTGLIAIIISLAACQDLTEDPVGFIGPDNFYRTIQQGEAALTTAMNNLWQAWAGYSYGYGDFVHDDQLDGGNLVIPPTFGTSVWDRHYRAIKNINGVIRGVVNGSIENATPDEVEGLLAQARFLRAYNYFTLVRLYGDLPLITEETPNPVTTPITGRTPAEQIYEFIIEDLVYASNVQHMPLTWSGQPGKPGSGAAKALLAKVYLTMATAPLNQVENYTKARDVAAELMSENIYALVPNVFDVFKKENKYGPEMIWSFNSTSEDPATEPQIWAPAIMEGWGDASIDLAWWNAWAIASPNEPRQSAYLVLEYEGTPYTDFNEQRPFVRKYIMPNITQEEYDLGRSEANFPILRYADVLLIFAEAENMAQNGPTTEAYDAINMVRRRAFNEPLDVTSAIADLPAGLTKEEFDAAVIQERNYELCFEYDRWFDIVRKRILPDVSLAEYLPNFSDEDYLYPVPEYDARILGSQNPGYVTN